MRAVTLAGSILAVQQQAENDASVQCVEASLQSRQSCNPLQQVDLDTLPLDPHAQNMLLI